MPPCFLSLSLRQPFHFSGHLIGFNHHRHTVDFGITPLLSYNFQELVNIFNASFVSITLTKGGLMEALIKIDLSRELIALEKKYDEKSFSSDDPFYIPTHQRQRFIDTVVDVCRRLRQHPYMSGRQISELTGLSKHRLAMAYKLIQRSDACQKYFKNSNNKDYFNVVKHYFNHRLYTLVFFVGNNCPNRCLFCPNVTIDEQGRRRLNIYKEPKNKTLSEAHFNRIFDDIATIKNRGTDILVKISGGLEPLTDTRTMDIITHLSEALAVPVKLFTNGLLLDDSEKRKIALKTTDIRISLITPDERQYEEICYPEHLINSNISALGRLRENITNLVRERREINPACKIGFNSVVLPQNHTQLTSLLQMAKDLEIDYVDFKPDYFSTYDPEIVSAMEESVEEAKLAAQFEPYQDLYVNFTSSLSRKDIFWLPWQGNCDAQKQSAFKMFITPFGHLSPVHYGAFPNLEADVEDGANIYSIGKISDGKGLLDAIEHPVRTPEIELKKLNPFELMLSLEITREEEDETWGFPVSLSPYHTHLKEEIPEALFHQFYSSEVL